jgi:hypothetical protein
MTEKKWDAVPNQSILANGGTEGQIVVPDSTLFRVKQKVFLKSDAQQSRNLVINGISKTGVLRLGKLGGAITDSEDLSDFLTADNAIIWAERQDRSTITPNDYERAVYDEEPVMAKRVTQVDPMGNKYSVTNPMPVRLSDGDINIGTVNGELEVQLSSKDGDPDVGDVHDSVRIGDEEYEAKIDSSRNLQVITANQAADKAWDDMIITRDPITQDITNIEYKLNGVTVRNVPFTRDAYENLVRIQKT